MNILFTFLASLNILVFGHSFAGDCTEYLPVLAVEADIQELRVARFIKANCSLQERYTFFKEDYNKGFSECEPGQTEYVKRSCTFKEAIQERKWDVVVFQNSLEGEGRYETIQPYLKEMIKYVKKEQKKRFGSEPRFCWNLFWPISVLLEDSSTEPHLTRMSYYNHSSQKAWEAYVSTAEKLAKEMKMEIIPSGRVIMNLRASKYNTPDMKEFTRDGYHMSHGAGRYAAACLWFEYFLQPAFGKSVVGNSLRMPSADSPVDDALAPVLQKFAAEALDRK